MTFLDRDHCTLIDHIKKIIKILTWWSIKTTTGDKKWWDAGKIADESAHRHHPADLILPVSNHMLTSFLQSANQITPQRCSRSCCIITGNKDNKAHSHFSFHSYLPNLTLSNLIFAWAFTSNAAQLAQAAQSDSAQTWRNIRAHEAGDNETLFSTSRTATSTLSHHLTPSCTVTYFWISQYLKALGLEQEMARVCLTLIPNKYSRLSFCASKTHFQLCITVKMWHNYPCQLQATELKETQALLVRYCSESDKIKVLRLNFTGLLRSNLDKTSLILP